LVEMAWMWAWRVGVPEVKAGRTQST
jgi:hypothetical protein